MGFKVAVIYADEFGTYLIKYAFRIFIIVNANKYMTDYSTVLIF